MKKLIYLEDAINEIARWIGYLDKDMISRVQIGLERLPSAQPEQRWIPIEEKGPGPNEIVLISVNGEVDVDWIDVDSTGYGCWYRCMKDVIDIDAWMPLPEPYREAGEADENDRCGCFKKTH